MRRNRIFDYKEFSMMPNVAPPVWSVPRVFNMDDPFEAEAWKWITFEAKQYTDPKDFAARAILIFDIPRWASLVYQELQFQDALFADAFKAQCEAEGWVLKGDVFKQAPKGAMS